MGAAYLAGIAAGYWSGKEDVKKNWALDRVFTPNMDPQKREKLKKGWKKAVKRAMDWEREE